MKLYNLQYDFVKRDRNYMVFCREEGLKNDQLNNIQVKMLLSNNIPNLLPFELEEMNFDIKLRYNVTSKKSLSNYIKTQEFNTKEFLRIFSNIVSIINDSKLYMLEEKNYIIHQDFIFIDIETLDIFLVYLPLKNILDKEHCKIELKRLFIYLFNIPHNTDVIFYNKIINYIENVNYNISDLNQDLPLLSNSDDCSINNNQINTENRKKMTDNKSLRYLSRFQKILLFSCLLLLIAFIWYIYLESQSEGALYISLGLTILIIDVAYVIIKIWRPKLKKATKNIVINDKKIPKADSDETILLKDYKKKVYLEVDRGTEVEKINISNKNFIIGRNKLAVNYIERSGGISRVHLEIIQDSTGYKAKDLGSKNGSYLNGDELIPNKDYPLKENDVIKLANTEFIVREVSII